MKINKMTASFGKLENESIAFHDGLNVVCAPNESGKSTWCAFIKSMLYGVDSSERAKIGYLPDKMRYAPWSGAPMEGSMELTADNCDITIMRRTKTKSAPMRDFSAAYTGSNVAVEKLTGANCGEMLTGVSKDVFCRSAFVAQGAVAVTGSKELEKRINAIVAAGDEHSSYSEADERLQAWKRKRKYNRRGALPELELRIDDDRAKLEQLQDTVDEEERLEEQLAQARQRCSSLETEVNESRRRQRKESLERLNRSRAELKQRSGSVMHNTTDVDTAQRAIRAIEIETYNLENPTSERQLPAVDSLIIGIDIDRELRREKITRRLKARLDEGMADEIRGLIGEGIQPEDLIYYGLEYKFITEYVIGNLTYDEMFRQLEIAIHQFAKRQMTWFRGMERRGFCIHWLDATLPMEEKVNTILRLQEEETENK